MPSIVTKLLNLELDPAMLSIAEELGMKIFPRSWKDIKMECSCPDWAVPCKHIAAVIYKISTEIDNNPFIVFELHNVNLQAELEKENIFIHEAMNIDIPDFSDLFEVKNTRKKTDIEKIPTLNLSVALHETLNSVELFPIYDPLLQLLDDNPIFYQNNGNFKEKYSTLIRKMVRQAQKLLKETLSMESFINSHSRYYDKKQKPILNRHTQVQLSINTNNQLTCLIDQVADDKIMNQLILEVWKIPIEHLIDYQPSVIALRHYLLLALNLLGNGAIVPKLVSTENNKLGIVWQPALLSKDVKILIEKTQALSPENLLLFGNSDPKPVTENQAVHIAGAFISVFFYPLLDFYDNDEFLQLFFQKGSCSFLAYGQKAIAGGIYTWLHKYFLTQKKYKPNILVDELDNETFQISINIQQIDQSSEPSIPLQQVLSQKKYEKQRFEILQSLGLINAFLPALEQYINRKGQEPLILDADEFAPFLMQSVPAIRLLDLEILLPKSLQVILKPHPSVHLRQKSKDSLSLIRLNSLLDFDWQVAIGDTVLDEAEFKRLFRKSEGLIKFKQKYVYVSPGDLEKLFKHFSATKKLTAFDMLRAALSGEYYGSTISLTDDVKSLIKQLTENEEVALPGNIHATLRPYQIRGYSWMYRNAQIGFGSLLADDMGLGKTLQVIAMILKFKEERLLKNEKVLVVVPTGLLTNWRAEIEKFAPDLNCATYHGADRTIPKNQDSFDIILTSYGIVRSDAAKLKKMKWMAIVADESQNIKNQDTAQSKALKSIPASTFIAMSGTPVENRLSELWSVMEFCNRGFLGSLSEFRKQFSIPIQNLNDVHAANQLKKVTAPFLMRRMKTDKSIISDLPDKIEMDCFGSLTPKQAALYQKILQKAIEEIEGITENDHQSLFKRQGLVLQMILALKQICNHPTQYLKNKIYDADLSGKTELLFDRLEPILDSNEKVLIFTQFTEMGELLKRFIRERFGEEPLFYHGGSTVKKRAEMVSEFQNDPSSKIFILSLKAGGTGLNLTAANHVIHYDLWWNPAVESQATDRAFRIGQGKNVMVHRFITKGTFEEKINEMIQSKKALANLTVSTGENWIGNLSNTELKEIFTLG